MIEKIAKYKKYILGVTGVLLALTMFVGVKYLMKPKYEELPEVKLREITDSKSFAVMVQNGDTYEEYTSTDNTWPGADYVFKEAKCTDNNGSLVNDAITFADGKATLTTNKTIYCTLYFDEKPKSTIEILRENDINSNISSEPNQGGMYRYQGTNDVPNWICFGTTNKEECIDETDSDGNSIPDGIDKYMYRIIGITEEGHMYLIKETFLKEGTQNAFAWNDKHSTSGSSSGICDNKICPEWGQNKLFKRLNGTSNGEIPGSGQDDGANTDIFVDSSEYEYLKSGDSNGKEASEWYNLIADHEWMYGDIGPGSYSSLNTYKGQPVYEIETGNADVKHYVGTDGNNIEETYRWSQKAEGKISLMYVHDYYYGYYDGSTEESRGNAGVYYKLKTSWIHFQKDGYNKSPSREWSGSRVGINQPQFGDVAAISMDYYSGWAENYLHGIIGVRPVFYLSSKAKIASGSGTKSDPFILEI